LQDLINWIQIFKTIPSCRAFAKTSIYTSIAFPSSLGKVLNDNFASRADAQSTVQKKGGYLHPP